MTNSKLNQQISFTNGSSSVQTGTVVREDKRERGMYYVVITCEAGMELWNAGFAVGSDIHESQIV
jgi:hypothetical protein